MRKVLRRVAIGVGCVLGASLIALLVLGAILTFPATPKDSGSLRFAGFIPLPKGEKGGLLTVLDYLSVDGRRLFVTDISTGDVFVVPLTGGGLPGSESIAVASGAGGAHSVVIDPVSRVAFVTRSGAGGVDAFDAASGRIVKHIPVDADVDGMILDPAHRLLYAVSGDPKLASLIDPATMTKVATVALGGQPEFAVFDPLTGLIYQNLVDSDAVAVVDPARRVVVDRWSVKPCAGPTGVALDTAGRRLFVVCGTNAMLAVVDLDGHRVVATLPIGGGPDSVAYDPGLRRIYASGRSGVLSVTQQDGPDAYRSLGAIKLHYGAHTLAVDPAIHRVYVAYASLIIPPRLAVFDAKP